MDAKNLSQRLAVRQRNREVAVEAARADDCRVKSLRMITGTDNHNTLASADPIHELEKSIDDLDAVISMVAGKAGA